MKTTKAKAKPKSASKSSLKKKAWDLFSLYIRQKYADEFGGAQCFTCGVFAHWKSLEAGHAIAGRHGAVLFDEEIVRPQCGICNGFYAGKHEFFLFKLKKEHGTAEEGDIWYSKKLVESNQILSRSRVDYEALIEELKCKIANLP